MNDKVRTKEAEICIKTKWRPIESQIFKLNQFQRNMSQIVPYNGIFEKKSLQTVLLKLLILELRGQNVSKFYTFLIGGGVFK